MTKSAAATGSSDLAMSTMEKIRESRALIERFAPECEASGRIAEPVLAVLRDSGLFRLTAARRAGGLGAPIREHVECVAEIGRSCPGTAWASGILSASTGMISSLPEQQRQGLFRRGNELFCFVAAKSGVATRTPDGYLISGQWPYASGCLHADWAVCGVTLCAPGGEPEGVAFAFIDLAAEATVEIVMDWQVSGLSGSGSNRVRAHNHFVPANLMMIRQAGDGHAPMLSRAELEPRDSWPDEVQIALAVLPSMLGAAGGLLDAVQAKMNERPIINWRYTCQSESHQLLALLGEASLKIDSAWMHVYRVCDVVDVIAPSRAVTQLEKVRAQAHCGYAMRLLREAAAMLMDIAGPGAFANASPIQRFWRDINIGSRHNSLNSALSIELLGRAMTGQPSNYNVIPEF